MRPPGEISVALLSAAAHLVRTENRDGELVRRGPTLQEMAHFACVGIDAAHTAVQNMRRAGKIQAVAERRVDYRNRPVAEYAPVQAEHESAGYFDLAAACAGWARG